MFVQWLCAPLLHIHRCMHNFINTISALNGGTDIRQEKGGKKTHYCSLAMEKQSMAHITQNDPTCTHTDRHVHTLPAARPLTSPPRKSTGPKLNSTNNVHQDNITPQKEEKKSISTNITHLYAVVLVAQTCCSLCYNVSKKQV